MKTVGEIMTRRLVVLTEEENLSRIEAGMSRFGLRHLPVVDDGKLVGLVSHRDLLRASVSTLEPIRDEKNRKLLEHTFVGEIMTRDVRTAREDTPLSVAAKDLIEGRFGCLPVVNEQGDLVGIVTEHDFLKLCVDILEAGDDEDEISVEVDAQTVEADVEVARTGS